MIKELREAVIEKLLDKSTYVIDSNNIFEIENKNFPSMKESLFPCFFVLCQSFNNYEYVDQAHMHPTYYFVIEGHLKGDGMGDIDDFAEETAKILFECNKDAVEGNPIVDEFEKINPLWQCDIMPEYVGNIKSFVLLIGFDLYQNYQN